jgi:hypothetical protein
MSLISIALSRYPNFDALASVEREGRWCQCCSRGSVLGSILGRQTAAGNLQNLAVLNRMTTSQVQAKITGKRRKDNLAGNTTTTYEWPE